jgi:CheY-like chemotaxis protein
MENRRRFPRYETEFEARICSENTSFSATLIDISQEGVGILSESPIETDPRVFISLHLLSEYPIMGIPVWSHYIQKEAKYHYRIGFETSRLDLEKLAAIGFPKRSEFVNAILSQAKKNQKKDTGLILFVDDEETIRDLIKDTLEYYNYKVAVASNGREGLNYFNNSSSFGLVITDIKMPIMDGIEFAKGIRNSDRPDTPIIATTGFSETIDKENGLFDLIIDKPFKLKPLLDTVSSYLNA